MTTRSYGHWAPVRPRSLVVACSDGRLQEATDSFLAAELGLKEFDRLYVPGGGGALAASDRDVFRAQQLRHECKYLVELHQVKQIILLFHGPTAEGPAEAVCADYRRKLPWATPEVLAQRQARDAIELTQLRAEWAADASVTMYRCEVGKGNAIAFRSLDPTTELHGSAWGEPFVQRPSQSSASPPARSGLFDWPNKKRK